MKVFHFDLETGDNKASWKTGIHQLAFIIEIDGKIEEEHDFRLKPFEGDVMKPEALEVSGVTLDEIIESPDYKEPFLVHKQLLGILGRYVDKYNPQDKFHLAGYNISSFDTPLLEMFFKKCKDNYFRSWFYSGNLDVLTLAAARLAPIRHTLPKSFKLGDVYIHITGKELEEDVQLHDALWDVRITQEMLNVLMDRPGSVTPDKWW